MSSTRPRLLFALKPYNGDEWLFYSSPHPHNPYEKSTVVAADFHTKFPKSQGDCIYASGLFYFPDVRISKNKDEDSVPVICNPITGNYAILPKLRTERETKSFFGFDPIDKQFKYKKDGEWRTRELHMWVLEDVEKQEWSKSVYPSPENRSGKGLAVVAMTTTGEMVLSENLSSKPYNVFYFSPEKNTFQCVNFQYVGANLEEHKHPGDVYAFGDHVEDLSVNDAKQLKSSVFDIRNLGSFESINKFDALRVV
ncbi:unnamed protein product [Arabidopsis halleri]